MTVLEGQQKVPSGLRNVAELILSSALAHDNCCAACWRLLQLMALQAWLTPDQHPDSPCGLMHVGATSAFLQEKLALRSIRGRNLEDHISWDFSDPQFHLPQFWCCCKCSQLPPSPDHP
ncbi:Hypothetical predicted protein [Podarcis lilfordi]|uniref:Uncharacterized protein n=1 Tax=Podarcis lilfordi TaxID=74358 RepID=A0AA35PDF1_9SAUR|nr:Hypothetical predicted protein [Podarcis lilfordi]